MYELDSSIKEALTKIAGLYERVAEIESDSNRAQLRERALSGDEHPGMCGQLGALVGTAVREASYALATVARAQATVAPWEQLPILLYNSWDIDTREIRLFEILTTDERYRSENRELRETVLKALREVEESEWEAETQEAEEKLIAAGFLRVERDDFEGYERGTEHITIEMNYRHGTPKIEWVGYKFSFERGNVEVLAGVSGEFGKLLEAVRTKPEEAS